MERGEEMKKGLAGRVVSEVRLPVCKVETEIRKRCRKDIRKVRRRGELVSYGGNSK